MATCPRCGGFLHEEGVQADLLPLRGGANAAVQVNGQSSDDLDTRRHGGPSADGAGGMPAEASGTISTTC